MKSGMALAMSVLALASFPLLAQQPAPGAPATQVPPAQATPPTQQAPATPQASSSAAAAPAVEMRPVSAELESKLDSKTAKSGDSVVVKTKSTIKMGDGTEIPKGSKLMGHVLGVQASNSGTNSQVVLQFDHVELKGGQSLPVHSQIQSIAPADAAMTASAGAPAAAAPTGGPASATAGTNPSTNSSMANRPSATPQTQAPGGAPETAAAGNSGAPAPGTVVATNGNIAIQTTSVPGVLLANNAPGQQDPRMAQASSILLGARRDVQLEGGTQMVVGVAAAGAQ